MGRPCSHPNHEGKQVSLIVESQGRADQANWTSCFCPHVPKTFDSSWVSLKTSSQMPTRTHDHRCRCYGWTCRQWNWKHQHWSHVIFADESRFSLYHCDGRAPVRQYVCERLVDCCIQEMDGNVSPSLMVWGAFYASGKSEQVVVDGTVYQQCLIGISRQNPLLWAKATFQRIFCLLLVHDNATCTPCCTKYTQFSSGWEGWGHAVACLEPWSKHRRTYLAPDGAVYQRYG